MIKVREKIINNWRILVNYLIVFLAVFVHYLLLVDTPLYSDDIYNSAIRGNLAEYGTGFFKFCWDSMIGWVHQGRFFPFAYINYLGWYLIPNIKAHMLFMVAFSVINVAVWGAIVRKATNDDLITAISILVSGFLMPLYTFDQVNAMVNFGGLLQLVTLFILLSILTQMDSASGENGKLIVSAIFATCAVFTYEIGLVIIPLNIIVALYVSKDIKETVKILKWHIFLSWTAAIGICFLKIWSPGGYPGAQLGNKYELIWKAFCTQMQGVFHWTLWDMNNLPSYLEDYSINIILKAIPLFGGLGIAFIGICFAIYQLIENKEFLRNKEIMRSRQSGFLVLAGITLWAGTSLLISMSEKYQVEITESGYPYTPYYLGVFGVGFIISGLMKGRLKYIFIPAVLMFSLFSGAIYGWCADRLNEDKYMYQIYTEPREAYLDAIDAGLIDKLSAGDLVVLDYRYCTTMSCNVFSTKRNDIKTSYYLYLINCLQKNEELGENIYDYNAFPGNHAYIARNLICDEYTVIMLGEIDEAEINPDGEVECIELNNVRLYVRLKDKNIPISALINLESASEVIQVDEETYILDFNAKGRMYSDDFWEMF